MDKRVEEEFGVKKLPLLNEEAGREDEPGKQDLRNGNQQMMEPRGAATIDKASSAGASLASGFCRANNFGSGGSGSVICDDAKADRPARAQIQVEWSAGSEWWSIGRNCGSSASVKVQNGKSSSGLTRSKRYSNWSLNFAIQQSLRSLLTNLKGDRDSAVDAAACNTATSSLPDQFNANLPHTSENQRDCLRGASLQPEAGSNLSCRLDQEANLKSLLAAKGTTSQAPELPSEKPQAARSSSFRQNSRRPSSNSMFQPEPINARLSDEPLKQVASHSSLVASDAPEANKMQPASKRDQQQQVVASGTCISANTQGRAVDLGQLVSSASSTWALSSSRSNSSSNSHQNSVSSCGSSSHFANTVSTCRMKPNNPSSNNNSTSQLELQARQVQQLQHQIKQESSSQNEIPSPTERRQVGRSSGSEVGGTQTSLRFDQSKRAASPNDHYTADGEPKREHWDMNIEFLLAVIGFAVDLGNVWRFPYICYMNGGGAFLIPYTILFILGGLPIFYLEMSLGQYFSSGCLTVWRQVCPLAKGIGYAMCLLNFFTSLYYNTIISWAVFFFVESFTSELPWTSCSHSWNSNQCKTIAQRQAAKLSYQFANDIGVTGRSNLTYSDISANFSSPTKEYFEREVLRVNLSSGIDDLGPIRQPLAIYLAIVFVCIYFAIWKGVKSTGKAVWITALLPYFVLLPLLVRGVYLEGAWLGIRYYLKPQWNRIFQSEVWVEAAKQIYFSLGPGFGTLMALSSYNKFRHNCRRDALIAASVNYFASFIAGFVIFAVLGYMATIESVGVPDVATEGPGLVFQVYPEGLATMGYSAVWSVLFFLMVITLGIDSTFGGLESVITGLCDEYPRVLRAHRGIFIGALIVIIYFCSLPTATCGGQYVIYVLESYGTSLSLLFIVLIETIIVCWVYGTERFCENLEEMSGQRPGLYWRICWKYISPSILVIIFLSACSQELSKYKTLTQGNYTYPKWAPIVGLIMTSSSVACIPIYALYHLQTKTSGTLRERLRQASRPIQDSRAEIANASQIQGQIHCAHSKFPENMLRHVNETMII